jgi:hypothetical protein
MPKKFGNFASPPPFAHGSVTGADTLCISGKQSGKGVLEKASGLFVLAEK